MNRRFLIAALAVLLAPSAAALAQQDVGTFQYWTTFTQDDPDGKMCFIAAQPQDKKYSQPVNGRDPVFFMVTSIPAKGIRNEVSTIIGYPFAPGADVTVDIDGQKFKLFTSETQGDTAWAVADQQAALVDRDEGRPPDVRRGQVEARHRHHRHLFAVGRHRRPRQGGLRVPLKQFQEKWIPLFRPELRWREDARA